MVPLASDPWPRPKHVDVTVIRLFPDVSIKDYVVAACNQRAAELRQAGQSDAQIFGSAHTLNAHGGVDSEVDVTIGGLAMEAQGPLAVEVVCAKWDGAILPPRRAARLHRSHRGQRRSSSCSPTSTPAPVPSS